jgi:hypothetical protein
VVVLPPERVTTACPVTVLPLPRFKLVLVGVRLMMPATGKTLPIAAFSVEMATLAVVIADSDVVM